MNLYEALKAGTSPEELLETFHRDLDEANARIAAEQEAAEEAKNEALKDARTTLAKSILFYADTILGEDCSDILSVEEIESILIQYENEMKNTIDIFNMISKTPPQKKKKSIIKTINNSEDDTKIIYDFIKSLK